MSSKPRESANTPAARARRRFPLPLEADAVEGEPQGMADPHERLERWIRPAASDACLQTRVRTHRETCSMRDAFLRQATDRSSCSKTTGQVVTKLVYYEAFYFTHSNPPFRGMAVGRRAIDAQVPVPRLPPESLVQESSACAARRPEHESSCSSPPQRLSWTSLHD